MDKSIEVEVMLQGSWLRERHRFSLYGGETIEAFERAKRQPRDAWFAMERLLSEIIGERVVGMSLTPAGASRSFPGKQMEMW